MGNILELAYNTEEPKMIIPEYGRNIQKMIDHAITIEDKEEQKKCADAIIRVMGQVNPHYRDSEDLNQKLWTHLFIMSDFKLHIESPYPKPNKETYNSKPEKVPYPKNNIKYGHYGKIMEDLINTAVKYPEGEDKKNLIRHIANLLKTSYLLWNRDTVNDTVIIKNLEELSNGALTISASELRDTNDILKQYKKKKTVNKQGRHQGKYKNRKKDYGSL